MVNLMFSLFVSFSQIIPFFSDYDPELKIDNLYSFWKSIQIAVEMQRKNHFELQALTQLLMGV